MGEERAYIAKSGHPDSPSPIQRVGQRAAPRQLGRHERGLRGRDHLEHDDARWANGCDHGVLHGVMGGIVVHFAEDHDLGRPIRATASAALSTGSATAGTATERATRQAA
jgi:hypothetical protein